MKCMISNWNLEWKRANSPSGKIMLDQLAPKASDILCLTESHTDFLASHHPIFAEADYGYPVTPTRRKVALWSKEPWQEVDDHLPNAPTGRFVAGITQTPFGALRVIGLCIPWERAHVSTGRKDRAPLARSYRLFGGITEPPRHSGPAPADRDHGRLQPNRAATPCA